jgi:hypothetical protein
MTEIVFQSTVYKVQTLIDMGLRVTLDLPEDAIAQAAQLMECKRQGIVLYVRMSDKPPANRNKQDGSTKR